MSDELSILSKARLEGYREGIAQSGQVTSDEREDVLREAMIEARREWRGYWQLMLAAAFFFGLMLGVIIDGAA